MMSWLGVVMVHCCAAAIFEKVERTNYSHLDVVGKIT